MAFYKKIIVAGPLVLECIYPRQNPRDSTFVRQAKRRMSSAAQQRMNFKNAVLKLELELAANYTQGDLWVTLTYDDDHLPKNREEAGKKIKAFWKRLRAERKAHGQDLKYHYNYEHLHGDGRWHHHCMITATGEDIEQLQRLWGQGHVEVRPLRLDREQNWGSIARYMCKEHRDRLGQRLWSSSRNIAKPEVETFNVPNETDIEAPKGALILEDADERNMYGHFHFIKYLAAGVVELPRRRAKRRKKPKRTI